MDKLTHYENHIFELVEELEHYVTQYKLLLKTKREPNKKNTVNVKEEREKKKVAKKEK